MKKGHNENAKGNDHKGKWNAKLGKGNAKRGKGNAKWGNHHIGMANRTHTGMGNRTHIGDDDDKAVLFGKGNREHNDDDNVALSDESIEDVLTVVSELERLDELDHGDTAGLEQGLEDMAEDLIADTFPPGCSWSCYLENYPHIAVRLNNTEAAALRNWGNFGQEHGRDCTCRDPTELEAAPQTKSAAEEEEEVVENIESIAEKIEELEGEDDDAAEVEKMVLAVVEEELIEATFPPGCTWECYLGKHPWLTDHIARTEGAAYEHFAQHGLDPWDCSCTQEGMFVRPASDARSAVWFSATVLMLAYWAVHHYRSLQRRDDERRRGNGASDSGGAHERLANVDGEEKPAPVEYRDTAGEEESPPVEYHDATDTSSFSPVKLSDIASFEIN